MSLARSEKLYCPKSPEGELWWGYLNEEKDACQEEIGFDESQDFKWQSLEKEGWSVIPVRIQEVEPDGT
jgi:hypothetical protein